jgi:hypothetical protein
LLFSSYKKIKFLFLHSKIRLGIVFLKGFNECLTYFNEHLTNS